MYVCDTRTLRILAANEAMTYLYGWSHAELLRMSARDFRPKADMPKFLAVLRRQRRSRVTFGGQWRNRKKDGTIFGVEVTISSIPFAGHDARLVMVNDISQRQLAKEALQRVHDELEERVAQRTAQLEMEISRRQRLERQILEISEREQRRIGNDLHDGLGQQLTMVKFLSSALGNRLARHQAPGVLSAARISRELDKALDEVRSIARGLHPVRPDDEGLMSALHELAISVTKLFRIHCRFDCPRRVLIHDHHAATNLYRIAQEAASNAARHARPKQIRIALHKTDGRVHLSVEDNGCGLPSPSRQKTGLGLKIMNYRASVIGAAVTVNRRHPTGTRMECIWKPSTKESRAR